MSKLDARRGALALAATLLLAVLWSCAGSSSRGGGFAGGPVGESDFVQKVADAVCGNLSGCCAAAGIAYDRGGCEAYVFAELELEQPPNTTWDSAAAGKCVDWFASVASSCDQDRADEEEGCDDIYRGTLPQGSPCIEPEECADIGGAEATCTYDDLGQTGSCVPVVQPIRGRAGDACSTTCTSSSCVGFGSTSDAYTICYLEDGLLCSYSQGVCVPPPALGEQCLDYYCATGAYCSSISLICEATKPNGASCENDEDCSGGSCVDYVCGPRTLASVELCSGQ